MKNRILTFEINKDNDKIELFFNREGYEYLKKTLEDINIDDVDTNHSHLMTQEWGGNELSDEVMHESNKLINHVKLVYINENNN